MIEPPSSFRFELTIGERIPIQLGHEIRIGIAPDGRWEVRDVTGSYPHVGRSYYLNLAVLDYIRKILGVEEN